MDRVSALIDALDISIFQVATETTPNDRQSFLLLQKVVRNAYPGYDYLEIGSHIGGSLSPHLVDPKCTSVISIDPRPAAQSDERGLMAEYPGNTTQRMLKELESAADATSLAKLRTFDADASQIEPDRDRSNVRLALIDAEHTNRAAFRDFLFALRMVERDSIIAFHDANILVDAIGNIETFLTYSRMNFRSYYLPDCVFAISFGIFAKESAALEEHALDSDQFVKNAKNWLQRIWAAAPQTWDDVIRVPSAETPTQNHRA